MTTISPGSTSRMKVAPTLSKAAVSEASIQPSASRPSDRGRLPSPSRTPMSWRLVAITSEKDPRRRGSRRTQPVDDVGTPIVGQELHDDAGVRRGLAGVLVVGLRPQLEGVDDVAVVRHGQRTDARSARRSHRPWRAVGGRRRMGWMLRAELEPVVE